MGSFTAVNGQVMIYTLVNGDVLTDEILEREADEFERGTWEGYLTSIRVGRPPLTNEKPSNNTTIFRKTGNE